MFIDTKETSFLQDLTKPSLEALSHILRHKDLWPEGFKWYYPSVSKCAIGLARTIWDLPNLHGVGIASRCVTEFGIPKSVAQNIFVGGSYGFWQMILGRVTPEMVADQIDKYLADREG